MPEKTVGGVPVSDSFAEATGQTQDTFEESNPQPDAGAQDRADGRRALAELRRAEARFRDAFNDPNTTISFDADDVDERGLPKLGTDASHIDDLLPSSTPSSRAARTSGAATTSGGTSNGPGGASSTGSGPATSADPVQTLVDMLRANTKDQVGGIRDAFKPQIENVKDSRKRSRKEIKGSATETDNAIQALAAGLVAALGGIDERTATARARTDAGSFADDATRGDISASRELSDTLTSQLRGLSVGSLENKRALTQNIRQAGLSTLTNNSNQLLANLRTQRAQQIAQIRAAGKESIFNLKAGQVGAAASSSGSSGGRSGGGFRSGGSSSSDKLNIGQILANDPNSQFYGQDPAYLNALDEAGLLDNQMSAQEKAALAAQEAQADAVNEYEIGKFVFDEITAGADPSNYTVDERRAAEGYGTERQRRAADGARRVGNDVNSAVKATADTLGKYLRGTG